MENKPLPFVFFGTPDVASETLEILKSEGFIPSLIITAPDRPVGRHFTITPCEAKVWALENNIPISQPEKITDEFIATLPPADIFIVVAYGKILPEKLINLPKLGTLNIHYSLLPRFRGASPVEAAILAGDTETGVSIQQMVFKLDAGPVIASEKIAIDPHDTTRSLRAKLIPLGANLLVKVLDGITSGEGSALAAPTPQDETLATHCGKTKKEDALVNPVSDDPELLYRKYRAYFGWPGIYFLDTHQKRVKITKAHMEGGKFIIERVIREGEKEMNY